MATKPKAEIWGNYTVAGDTVTVQETRGPIPKSSKGPYIDDIAVVGLAKRLEEVWVPGQDYPVILPRTSERLPYNDVWTRDEWAAGHGRTGPTPPASG